MIRRRVFPAIRLLALSAVALAAAIVTRDTHVGQAAPRLDAVHYTNPVFARTFPDPMVLRLSAHDYYAYATTVPWEKKGYFPILHSKDMVHWTYVGDLFKKAPSWSNGDFWAPDVIKRGKTYYAYYTGLYLSLHCIGVATSSSPKGPFKNRARLACADNSGMGYIDPDIFIDQGGQAYLYFSVDAPEHNISVMRLKKDLLHTTGKRIQVLGANQDWEHGKNRTTVEGPYVIRRDNTYYLFFSGNDWEDNYQLGYATSSSPTGPFTAYSGDPIMKSDSHVFGPGGGSIVQGPDGGLWMAYHAWPSATGRSTDRRNLRIDPLQWSGSTVSIHVTP